MRYLQTYEESNTNIGGITLMKYLNDKLNKYYNIEFFKLSNDNKYIDMIYGDDIHIDYTIDRFNVKNLKNIIKNELSHSYDDIFTFLNRVYKLLDNTDEIKFYAENDELGLL